MKGVTALPVAKPGDLGVRIVSALVLAPPVLAAVYYGSPAFEFMVAIAVVLMAWEWNRLCAGAGNRFLWRAAGVLAIGLPCLALVWLRRDPDFGRQIVFWLFALVWATDIGAYAAGKLIGGPKLAPRISPAKTWAGLIGGVGCAGAVGAVAAVLMGSGAMVAFVALSACLGAVSQAGDLTESWIKRRFRVKDASNIIPGHGGMLDRVDGLLAASAAVALIDLGIEDGLLAWL